MRQKAVLCASLPGAMGPGSVAAQIRAARSAAATAASSSMNQASLLSSDAARPLADPVEPGPSTTLGKAYSIPSSRDDALPSTPVDVLQRTRLYSPHR